MALHPDVQAKCQEEIREEIGSRPPNMDDLSKLTYVLATLNEIQRLSIVAPGKLLIYPHFLITSLAHGPPRIFEK